MPENLCAVYDASQTQSAVCPYRFFKHLNLQGSGAERVYRVRSLNYGFLSVGGYRYRGKEKHPSAPLLLRSHEAAAGPIAPQMQAGLERAGSH